MGINSSRFLQNQENKALLKLKFNNLHNYAIKIFLKINLIQKCISENVSKKILEIVLTVRII